jgi:hypothetical protein
LPKRFISAAIDLVSEARQCCLTADVLVQALVEATQATTIDERVMALVYAVEESVGAAQKATEKAIRALR